MKKGSTLFLFLLLFGSFHAKSTSEKRRGYREGKIPCICWATAAMILATQCCSISTILQAWRWEWAHPASLLVIDSWDNGSSFSSDAALLCIATFFPDFLCALLVIFEQFFDDVWLWDCCECGETRTSDATWTVCPRFESCWRLLTWCSHVTH